MVKEFIEKLFSGQLKWYDTILPRIPGHVQKSLEQAFKDSQEAEGKYGGGWGSGSDEDGGGFWGGALKESKPTRREDRRHKNYDRYEKSRRYDKYDRYDKYSSSSYRRRSRSRSRSPVRSDSVRSILNRN